MKVRYFFIGMIFINFACKELATKNDIPDNQLINEIIVETVKQDSLNTSLSISNKLINYYLFAVKIEREPENDSILPPPPPPPPRTRNEKPLTLYYFRLNQEKLIGYSITKEDSIFFERQIANFTNVELDSTRFENLIRIEDIIHRKTVKVKGKAIYEFVIPIFNKEKTIAWVEYNTCGYGRMVIFKKTNNKWVKIDSYTTWIS